MSLNKKTTPEVTILFPIYNEADTIEKVISEFYEEVGRKIPLEILVVEDGSTDGTKEILEKLSHRIPMTLIMSKDRKGYSKALADGLKRVRTDLVFCTDSDGQHFAKDFWELYQLKNEYDVISGCRIHRSDALHRKIMSRAFQEMAKTLFKLPRFKDVTAPFRLIKTEVAKSIACEFKYMRESFWTEFTIRAHRKGARFVEVGVTHRDRLGDGSTRVYKPLKIPKIAASQFKGLLKLWLESKNNSHSFLTHTSRA